jgi:hypothetical protein
MWRSGKFGVTNKEQEACALKAESQKSEIKEPAYVPGIGLVSAHLSRSQVAAAAEGETPNAEAEGGDPRNQLSP